MDFVSAVVEMQSGRVIEQINNDWKEVVDAVQAGKVGAGSILKYLGV
jgi:hypothetical protein